MDEVESVNDFESAAAHVASLAIEKRLGEADLLRLYACYKQATSGPCTGARPGMFSLTARRKYDAWKSLGEMSSTDAALQYVDILDQLQPEWREKSGGKRAPRGFGVSVSTPQRCEESEPPHGGESIWELAKAGKCSELSAIDDDAAAWDAPDEEGLAPIHWAADRGHADVVQLLLARGASVDARDSDGQTALHYAACCGHVEVARALLSAGADPEVKDDEGLTPADGAAGDEVLKVLEGTR